MEWSQVLFYMVGFAVLPTAGVFIAQFLTKGLLFKLIAAKVGRRKGAILIKVHTVTEPYYRVGKLKGSLLTYTPRNNKLPTGEKIKKALTVPKGVIIRDMGVPFIEVDEESNNILTPNFGSVSGHDAELVEGLMTRIAMLRKLADKKELIILIVVCLTLAVVAYVAYQQGQIMKVLEALNQVSDSAGIVV